MVSRRFVNSPPGDVSALRASTLSASSLSVNVGARVLNSYSIVEFQPTVVLHRLILW